MKTPKKISRDYSGFKQSGSFSIKGRFRSFTYAFRGLLLLISREQNARIHFAATITVFGAAVFFGINELEWCVIVFAIGFVWTAEALNTAIEYLADALCPGQNELVGKAKDLAAAGVLLAAMTSLVIGLIVFVPYVTDWLATMLHPALSSRET